MENFFKVDIEEGTFVNKCLAVVDVIGELQMSGHALNLIETTLID